MRTVGNCKKLLDKMSRRAVSRETRTGTLADFQGVQFDIADSYIELEQFKLFVLKTAWTIDKYNDYRVVRKDIAAIKALMPTVYANIAKRCIHIHGSLGVSNEMPFVGGLIAAMVMGIADGPTEVHKVTVAKQHLKQYRDVKDPVFPDYSVIHRRQLAMELYPDPVAEIADAAEAVA
jgi:acyl-CoA dehydrogenase